MGEPSRIEAAPEEQPQVYEDSQIRRAIVAADPSPTGARDRLIVVLLWAAGLRVRELMALRPFEVDLEHGRVHVRAASRSAGERVVMLPRARLSDLNAAISNWSGPRSAVAYATTPLVCNLEGGVLDPSYVRHALPELGRRAGIRGRFCAQGLRATFAADMYTAGVSLETIARQLGHGSISTTSKLLQRVCPERVAAAHAYFALGAAATTPPRNGAKKNPKKAAKKTTAKAKKPATKKAAKTTTAKAQKPTKKKGKP